MTKQFQLGNTTVDVVLKDIKNVHLSVYPPTGRVRISAPTRMSLNTIRVFAISKLDWIKQQQKKLLEQERETPREYLDRESHYVWGRRCLLSVIEHDQAPRVELKHSRMILMVRAGTDERAKDAIVARWYRWQVKAIALELIAKWEPRLGVRVNRVFVQQMKTKWGGCNPRAHTIRLNTDLARKPKECLEYIIVHELVHLIERHHNEKFIAIMDEQLPHWRMHRTVLNAAPLSCQSWKY